MTRMDMIECTSQGEMLVLVAEDVGGGVGEDLVVAQGVVVCQRLVREHQERHQLGKRQGGWQGERECE